MSVYGISSYDQSIYGLDRYPAYSVEPFTARSVNYGTLQVTWTKPSGSIFRYRLLANRYGYPVNETDGTVLFDSTTYPGSSYVDTSVIAGTYHYYGFYVLVDVTNNIWIRSGVSGCLAVKDYGSSNDMWNRLPEHFRTLPETGGELTGDAAGNPYLKQFVNVLGYSADYLRTQYGMLAEHYNDPMVIPIDDLWNLAAEVGLHFSPELPAYTIRKAVANQAHVCREGGTTQGIGNEIIIRTGWAADITTGPNLMLEDDQSTFIHPIFTPYSPYRYYYIGDYVWTGAPVLSRQWPGLGFWYQCISPCQGIDPTGVVTQSANWKVVKDADDTTLHTLLNSGTGFPSTWEAVDISATSGLPTAGSLIQGLGVKNLPGTGNAWNSLRLKNTAASSKTLIIRSAARQPSQVTGAPWAVDPQSAVQDAVPVPYVRDSQQWSPAIRYGTGDIVLCQGQPFTALRASTGIRPPANNIATPEWAPLSESRRIRIAASGYISDNMTGTGNPVKVNPCMEWYDATGNFITRVTARNTSTTGNPSKPDNFMFDSFTGSSRVFNVQGNNTAPIGPWQATYWQNQTLTGTPVGSQSVPNVNFSLDGTTSLFPSLANTGWSASWVTRFLPPSTGNYTFSLKGLGGGTRLLINGIPVINAWAGTPTSLTSATIQLPGGSPVTVEVDYVAPAYTQGSGSTPNLIAIPNPVSTGSTNYTFPALPVIPGIEYGFGFTAPGFIGATITWYGPNSNQPIGTTQFARQAGQPGIRSTATVPAGATSASVTIGADASPINVSAYFLMATGAPVASGLTVTSQVTFTPTTSLLNTNTLTGRTTDDNLLAWQTPVGNFSVGNGNCWPLIPGQRSIGLVPGPANTKLGVTFRTGPQSGQTQGMVFRYTDDNNYWRCSRTDLRKKVAGTWALVATHSTAFADNDRMIIVLNGPVIQVFRNAGGTPVSSVSDTFNSSATKHGVIVEQT